MPVDYAQSALWFRKAADQDNSEAQENLGHLYSNGKGVPQSYSEAYFWLDIAASKLNGPDQERVAKTRDDAAAKLTPEELSEVQKRATEWSNTHRSQGSIAEK